MKRAAEVAAAAAVAFLVAGLAVQAAEQDPTSLWVGAVLAAALAVSLLGVRFFVLSRRPNDGEVSETGGGGGDGDLRRTADALGATTTVDSGPVMIPGSLRAPPDLTIWTDRAGGPLLQLRPGVDQGWLLCHFEIIAGEPIGGVEARWLGAGASLDWAKPMPENGRLGQQPSLRFQMKPTEMNPSDLRDEVTFEVRFNLTDGLHGGRWVWPIRQSQGGDWTLDPDSGSGVGQPLGWDTW